MNSARISYTTRLNTTQETEIATLASVYRLLLDSANKNVTSMASINGDDATVKNNEEVKNVDGRTD